MTLKNLLRRSAVTDAYEYRAPLEKANASLSSTLDGTMPNVQGKEATFGTDPIIKTFYPGKGSHHGRLNWVETPPKQLKEKIAKAYDRVAIKVYKSEDPEMHTITGRTPLRIQAIEIQSPILVAALKEVLEDEGVFLDAQDMAKFSAPFRPLYFAYKKIFALHDQIKDDMLFREHLTLLTQLMTETFGSTMLQVRNLQQSGLISYKHAWTYFPKGCLIYGGAEDCERLYRVVDTEYVTSPQLLLTITCQNIVFNGTSFEWTTVQLQLPDFAGNVPISSLQHYPLQFHANAEALKSRLIARGKKVLDYQGLNYCEYVGTGIANGDGYRAKRHNVSGRILVDFYGYAKHHKGLSRQQSADHSSNNDSVYVRPLNSREQQANKAGMLARSQDLMFTSPMLSGFALKDKLWLQFYVDDVRPVVWNDEAYSHLVYPEEQKDLVLTFVSNHRRMKGGLDDVIVGKGQGLIQLLSGPPGTGKTLLAEAVADKTRRPLYYLQAEELGTNASHLGQKIKKVFEMATEWDAIILLDEADVFMAQRSPADVVRNELVSIFLRELEYFQGIIFLTTNLFDTIDKAFRSRVNIHLVFDPLSFASRVKLWTKFLERVPVAEVGTEKLATQLSDADVQQLAAWELNGREIKNAIKTVRTWCVCKGYQVSLQRLESGIVVTAPQARRMEGV